MKKREEEGGRGNEEGRGWRKRKSGEVGVRGIEEV